MTPDFRALCAELTEALGRHDLTLADENLLDRVGTAYRASAGAALAAEPVGEGPPSEDELIQLLFDDHRTAIEFACDTEKEGNIIIRNHIAFARAVLARWGCLAAHPAPVPVAERLPEEGDCLVQNTGPDGEPEWWCWFYRPGLDGVAEWRWNTTPRISEWYGWQGATHWLPHWALPLPQEAQP